MREKTDKVSKDGNKLTVTEYEVRDIDQYGDALDVSHWPTKAEAITEAQKLVAGGAVAAVVEKHVSKYPAFKFNRPNIYTVIATFGSADALNAGGWTEDYPTQGAA